MSLIGSLVKKYKTLFKETKEPNEDYYQAPITRHRKKKHSKEERVGVHVKLSKHLIKKLNLYVTEHDTTITAWVAAKIEEL